MIMSRALSVEKLKEFAEGLRFCLQGDANCGLDFVNISYRN